MNKFARNYNWKVLVFLALCSTFIFYSVYVYTAGTKYTVSQEEFTEEAHLGQKLYQKYNCVACHQIYGLGGYLGPDLTHCLDRANGSVERAKTFLKMGSNIMPNYELHEEEIDQLMAYLTYVNNSSNYKREAFVITKFGAVKLEERK